MGTHAIARFIRTERATVAFFLAALVGLILIPGVQAHGGEASELFERAEITLMPFTDKSSPTLDGTVIPGEYSAYGAWNDPVTGFEAYLLREDESVYVALVNPVPGWMALGFSSDLDEGMGLVLVAEVNRTFQVLPAIAQNVSDEMAFAAPEPSAESVIEAFNVSRQGNRVIAEVRLATNGSLWTLEPGELVPTVLAFSETTTGMPSDVAGSEVRFLRSYILRPQDSPEEIEQLFMEDISPIPGLIAVGAMAVGVSAIFASFTRKKGAK